VDTEAMIAAIKKQEAELRFDSFDEHAAYAIGSGLRERAAKENLSITVDIHFWDRRLFYCAMPGTTGMNAEWMRRKAWVVRNRGRSSYLQHLQTKGRELPADWAVGHNDYALHGGAFPIHVKGTGIVGAIIVSGLTEREDHRLVIEALCRHFGRDAGEFALPEG
jgi:uncharacterized protein (UPF0303 family)